MMKQQLNGADNTGDRNDNNNNNNNNNNDDDDDNDDLDIFLTTIESKLRGPFSSLDLAKAVTTNALRGSLTPANYLQNIARVLGRTDKVIQSRMLIGLLGLDPSVDTTPEIYHILQQAQDAPEEWVRTMAGLIQGIMFEKMQHEEETAVAVAVAEEEDSSPTISNTDNSKKDNHGYYARTSRGPEATKVLDQLCQEVRDTVRETMSKSAAAQEADEHVCADLNASFAPYRYSLLPERLWKPIMPERGEGHNPHFQVRRTASILQLDEQLEAQRAKEEQEHQGPVLMKTKLGNSMSNGANATTTSASAAVLPPGFRPVQLVSATKKSSSSMFMPKKPNAMLVQRQRQVQQKQQQQQQQQQKKTMLRRKGAAQSLVNKSSMKSKLAKVGGGPTTGAVGAAEGAPTRVAAGAGKFGTGGRGAGSTTTTGGGSRAIAARSKMKMIDVQEVGTLAQEHAARESATQNSRLSKKRRILDAAMQRGLKKTKTATAVVAPTTVAPELAAASAVAANKPAPAVAAVPPTAATATDGSTDISASVLTGTEGDQWKSLLQERSNKLSEEDRERVQQFFVHRYNPNPEEKVVKMKLHEQRSNDPENSGQPIKETFYLELDYTNFTSRQSRKVKRY